MQNQYEDLYDKTFKAILTVEAKYACRTDSDNPYVTALPPRRTPQELINACTVFPGLPNKETFNMLSKEDKLNAITKLGKARMYLPYYAAIEEAVDRALLDSYERRVSIETDNPYRDYTFHDSITAGHQRSEITEMSDAPTGFSLLGQSGCGKTTGINNVLRKYPKCIIHKPKTVQQHVQIPILLVHMSENSNFHGLYAHIGERIDAALGNISGAYQNELGRKGDSLSVKFNKLCELVKIFNIGLLIIDEIELLDTKHIKEGTMETFMSLNNRTGIAIGVIGTEDAFEKLFRYPRTIRRLGEFINADKYCSSIQKVEIILKTLYMYLPVKMELTEDCLEAYYTESGGVIAYISKIFVGVAQYITEQGSKGKASKITPKLIHNVARKKLAAKRFMDKQRKIDYIVEDEDYSEATLMKLIGNSNMNQDNPFEEPEIMQEDRLPTFLNIVKAAIHAFPDNKSTDEEIESALQSVIRKRPKANLQEAINGTFIELKRREEGKIKRKKKTEGQKKAVIDLQEMLNSLTTTTDIE